MENNTNTIENLLSQVSSITQKYDEIAYATGEKFNIFSVLKLEIKNFGQIN